MSEPGASMPRPYPPTATMVGAAVLGGAGASQRVAMFERDAQQIVDLGAQRLGAGSPRSAGLERPARLVAPVDERRLQAGDRRAAEGGGIVRHASREARRVRRSASRGRAPCRMEAGAGGTGGAFDGGSVGDGHRRLYSPSVRRPQAVQGHKVPPMPGRIGDETFRNRSHCLVRQSFEAERTRSMLAAKIALVGQASAPTQRARYEFSP